MNKKLWALWLGLSGLAFGVMEYISIKDSDSNTHSLTYTIISSIPADIFFIIFGGFGVWALWHFFKYYNLNSKKK